MIAAPLRGEKHLGTRKAAAGNDRLSKPSSGLLGKAPSTYSADAASPTENVEVFPLDWKTRRGRAAFRLADIVKLARERRHRGLSVDPGNFAFALASTLGSVAAGLYGIPRRQRFLRWYCLDLESLKHTIARADLGSFDNAELETIIEGVERYSAAHGQKLMSATVTGRLLAVTSAERAEFKLTQIEAVDEPRADRVARQQEAKRKRDRERCRVQRGCKPRRIYEAQSLAKRQPWADEGICRRTWERHRSRVASLQPCVPLSTGEATDLRQAVAPSAIHTEPGPARSGDAERGVGADVPSHRGKTGIAAITEDDEQPPTRGAGPTCGAQSEQRGDQHERAA